MLDENFGKNIGKLLGNAKQMQEKMEEVKQQLEKAQVSGAAGGDMVVVVINGARKVVSVTISDEAMADRDMLQDLIAAAVSDATRKIEQTINDTMQKSLMGGLGGIL